MHLPYQQLYRKLMLTIKSLDLNTGPHRAVQRIMVPRIFPKKNASWYRGNDMCTCDIQSQGHGYYWHTPSLTLREYIFDRGREREEKEIEKRETKDKWWWGERKRGGERAR